MILKAVDKTRTTPAILAVLCQALVGGVEAAAAADANTLTNREPLALWDATVRASVGGGYRDNILLSSVAPEGSPFIITSADASLIWLSESGRQFTAFVMGEDVRYTDSTSVDKEQFFSGSVRFATPAGSRNELGAQSFAFYQYQVLDVSSTETNLQSVLVEGYGISGRPYWMHQLGGRWSVQVEGLVHRQFYLKTLDDYWEGGGRLDLFYKYGRRSELSAGLQSLHRLYDTRTRFTRDGASVPGTSLIYWRPEVSARWRHYWDPGRHWRTTVRAACLLNRDNGSSYFDYDRVSSFGQLQWRNHGWEVRGDARFEWYFYRVQHVNGERRRRSSYALEAHAEKHLGKHLLLYATASREWVFSNDTLDQYDDWTASGGVGVEF